MTYSKLKDGISLRGWQRLPYAVCDIEKSVVQFLRKPEFDTLLMCNGNVDFSHVYVLPVHREILEKLLEHGIVDLCEKGDEIKPDQKYRLYDNRFTAVVHWSMTGKCNYKCKHCYMSAPDAKFGELTHDQCAQIINQMADCGVMRVSLTGGECLVRSDFLELVDLMLKKHIKITQIYSNGFLVNERLLDELEKRGIKPEFNMSYDGLGWHDWMRGVDGAEDAVIKAFELCRKRGFPTGAEMCIHQGNKLLLRESVNRLAELGVSSLKTNPVFDSEMWAKHSKDYSVTTEEIYELYLDYIPDFFEDGSPLTLMLGGFFRAEKGSKEYSIPAAKLNGTEDMERICICGHARNTMYLAADGKMLPCMPLSGMDIQNKFPNILDIGLAKGLSDSFYMSVIDMRLKEYLEHNKECASCRHKYVCGGGCRAGALREGEDYLAADLSICKIFKGSYPEKIKAAVEKIST